MSTPTEAERLANWLENDMPPLSADVLQQAAAELRRLAVVEAERDRLLARLDRAISAAEEHFGEDAVRYKLSLFANGRARNIFPARVDGRWFALQPADNDAHVGLALRCAEAEQERDALRRGEFICQRCGLRKDADASGAAPF
jgi:hypothetical protein